MENLRPEIERYVLKQAANSLVDLRSVFQDPGQVSPPPTAHERMPMDEPVNTAHLMEVVVYYLFKSGAELTAATWQDLFLFDQRYGRDDFVHAWKERVFVILYIVAKVDMAEYTDVIKVRFDSYFAGVLQALGNIVGGRMGAGYMSVQKAQEGKTFLKSPVIINALSECLRRALDGQDLANEIADDRIRSIIDEMRIFAVDELSYLRGVTVRDGVVLNLLKLDELQSNAIKYKANYLTQLLHEASHFIVRRFVNDLAFTSPIKYGDSDAKLMDPVIGSKGFEMGRYAELLVFGMQPNWRRSTRLAAYMFYWKAHRTRSSLPLFSSIERALLLKKRAKPSVSMAGDFSDSLPRINLPDIGC